MMQILGSSNRIAHVNRIMMFGNAQILLGNARLASNTRNEPAIPELSAGFRIRPSLIGSTFSSESSLKVSFRVRLNLSCC